MGQDFPHFPRESRDLISGDGKHDAPEFESDPCPAAARFTPVVLRSPPNWTAIIFFLALGLLHLGFATSSFAAGRPEGYLSLFFGTAFTAVAFACWMACCEVAVIPIDRRVRLSTGFRRFRFERFVPFDHVRAVRLTLSPNRGNHDSRIELLCDAEEIECPATNIPRQQALYLALTLNVRLIKVCPDDTPPTEESPERPRL